MNLNPGERPNGSSHCKALVLATSACLNVVDGRLQLGRWQRVFLVELDGPRSRDISVLLMGEAGAVKVKMILPALTEATSPFWRPIKYSLFPPLGLATLAGYLDDDEVEIQDEHVETLDLNDTPDLVVIQVYITSAYRAYRLADHYRARGAYVVLGGLHVTSLPDEAAAHADTIFIGPGEDTWPRFLADFRRGQPEARLSLAGSNTCRPPADSARSDQASPLSRPELDRRLARLSARLRLLLQGSVLRRRPVVLYADRRCRARGDRAAPRPSSLLPGRSPVRRPPLRLRALRRDAGNGPPVAGGRHGQRRAGARIFSSRRSRPACGVCSSGSRHSTPPT